MLKKVVITGISMFILPLYVSAADLFISSCLKTDGTSCEISDSKFQIETGQTVKITMSIESDKVVNGLSAIVSLTNMNNITGFVHDSIWNNQSSAINQISDTTSKFMVGRDQNEIPGSENSRKEVGSFNVTAGSLVGDAKIEFSDIKLSYIENSDFEITTLTNVPLLISVVDSNNDNTTPDDNNNTNTDTNTNDNTNTNTDAKTDVSETKKEVPSNPDTGVTLSALGIALLVVGGISYISLRKKNYFNKI